MQATYYPKVDLCEHEYPPDCLAGGIFYRLLDTLNADNPTYVKLP